jgi:hypothetical protein
MVRPDVVELSAKQKVAGNFFWWNKKMSFVYFSRSWKSVRGAILASAVLSVEISFLMTPVLLQLRLALVSELHLYAMFYTFIEF